MKIEMLLYAHWVHSIEIFKSEKRGGFFSFFWQLSRSRLLCDISYFSSSRRRGGQRERGGEGGTKKSRTTISK
jgi:hypothetical protein